MDVTGYVHKKYTRERTVQRPVYGFGGKIEGYTTVGGGGTEYVLEINVPAYKKPLVASFIDKRTYQTVEKGDEVSVRYRAFLWGKLPFITRVRPLKPPVKQRRRWLWGRTKTEPEAAPVKTVPKPTEASETSSTPKKRGFFRS
jgi:hypothetical protein